MVKNWEPHCERKGRVQTMGSADKIDKGVLSTQTKHFSINILSHYKTKNTLSNQ